MLRSLSTIRHNLTGWLFCFSLLPFVFLLLEAGCGPAVCRDNGDCPTAQPICVQAACRQCAKNDDCKVSGTICNEESGTCIVAQDGGIQRDTITTKPDKTPVQDALPPQETTLHDSKQADRPGNTEQHTPDDKGPETTKDQPTTQCRPGITQPCYTGPSGTEKNAPCLQGLRICQADGTWSAKCLGEITPQPETCNGRDDNCDGQIDESFKGLNQPCQVGVGACQQAGKGICHPDGTSVTCTATPGTPSAEICDGKDNDCDGQVDEDFAKLGTPCSAGKGACQQSGSHVCSTDGKQAICNAVAGKPKTEVCDGKTDENCDGNVDEGCACQNGASRPCGPAPVGICKQGTQSCQNGQWGACKGQITKQTEICDGKDNDCDGAVDETLTKACYPNNSPGCTANAQGTFSCKGTCKTGIATCSAGKWGTCQSASTPQTESCDGKDNDCDGQVDETFSNLNKTCTNGVGSCNATGKYICKSDGKGTSCNAKPGAPQAETCDGKDNDCDGQIDNNPTNVGKACKDTTQKGLCQNGLSICRSGSLSCQSTTSPAPEICDGEDNNCDGQIDNSPTDIGQACQTGKPGECADGKMVCNTGKKVCESVNPPTTEVCRNNKDDDCDGQTDETCGTHHSYVVADSKGKIIKGNNITVQRTGTGEYELEAGLGRRVTCQNTPIFLTPSSSDVISIVYTCQSSGEYDIEIFDNSPYPATRKKDSAFSAVIPTNDPGEIFGTVSSCGSGSGTCPLTASNGTATVKRISTGEYEITAVPCQNQTTPPPILVQVQKGQYNVRRMSSVSFQNGKCMVYTYNSIGQPTNVGFSFWLINPKNHAYAQVNATGQLGTNNNFGDTNTKWTSSLAATSITYTAAYNGWGSPSAVFLTPIVASKGSVAIPVILGQTASHNGQGVDYVFYSKQGGNQAALLPTNHTIFFVQ